MCTFHRRTTDMNPDRIFCFVFKPWGRNAPRRNEYETFIMHFIWQNWHDEKISDLKFFSVCIVSNVKCFLAKILLRAHFTCPRMRKQHYWKIDNLLNQLSYGFKLLSPTDSLGQMKARYKSRAITWEGAGGQWPPSKVGCPLRKICTRSNRASFLPPLNFYFPHVIFCPRYDPV